MQTHTVTTHTVTTYTASELKEQFPDAFDRALNHYRDGNTEIPWQDETIDSLKAILKATGITLRDYSLGAYNRGNHIRIEFQQDEAGELTGKRAIAWLENNLYGLKRISYTSPDRWKRAKYNDSYRSCHPAGSPVLQSYCAGHIPPYAFTGYCADEIYTEALNKAVRSGDTLKEAFEGLADVCMDLLEKESESQNTEEAFLETADASEWQFEEDGTLF